MREQLIIGIDPSSAKVAAVITKDRDATIDYRTTVKRDMAGGPSQRPRACATAYNFMEQIIVDYSKAALVVFMEAPIIVKIHLSGIIPQSMISGAIQTACYHNSIPIHLVTPPSWKKEVIGKGNADKEAIRAWLKTTWPAAYDLFSTDQDLCDSAGLNRYGSRILRRQKAMK